MGPLYAPKLEVELQCKLHNPRRDRAAADQAECGRGGDGVSRIIELSVVPNVVELGPKFQARPLGYFRIFDK